MNFTKALFICLPLCFAYRPTFASPRHHQFLFQGNNAVSNQGRAPTSVGAGHAVGGLVTSTGLCVSCGVGSAGWCGGESAIACPTQGFISAVRCMPENNPPNNHELVDNDPKNVWMYTTKSRTSQPSYLSTRDYIAGVAESADGSYILGVGFNKVKVVNDAHISQPGNALIVKLDARTGRTLWEYEVPCTKDCGFESVAFTNDGGFVVGGWRRDCGTLGTDQCLMFGMKSGGFVDMGLGVVQKFSKDFAESQQRPTAQRVWEFTIGEGDNDFPFVGSAKIVMPLDDGSIMALVSGAGDDSNPQASMNNPLKLTQNGALVWKKANKRMQANAMTLTSEGVVVVGQGENGGALDVLNPDGTVKRVADMPAPKYKLQPSSNVDFAAAQFANFQFKDAPKATAQCDGITLVECWGVTTHPLDATKALVSCGTGIEPPEGSPTDTICRSDSRTIWRSYTVEIDVRNGKPSWISLDNFAVDTSLEGPVNPAEATVTDSAGEWIAVNKNFPDKALIVGDNTGIGFFVLDTTLSNPAPPTPAPTTTAPTTQAPTTTATTTTTTEATEPPTTEEPTTQRPTTQAPTTQAPTTQAPTTQAPTPTEEPENGSQGENEGSNPDEGEGSNPDEGEGTIPDEGEGTMPDEEVEVGSGSGAEEVGSGGSGVEEVGSGNGVEEGSGAGVEEGSGEERQLRSDILCV